MIEHLVHIDLFVSEIRRVLKPNGLAFVCSENLASWHNLAALALGLQPFLTRNLSDLRPIGNPLALHAGRSPREVTQAPLHIHVMAYAALATWGTGYHPLAGRAAMALARVDPRHAHFIAVTAQPA